MESLILSDIIGDTVIIANDPGHRNPLTIVKVVNQKTSLKCDLKKVIPSS